MAKKTNVSIIIPVYNEEKNIPILYKEITKVFAKLKYSYEIIFIDDASRDKTSEKIRDLAKKDKKVVAIHFSRNYGQTAALSAGIHHCVGEVIVPMDGDLQNDPKDIPKLLQKIDEGYSVVSGWRRARKDEFLRVFTSKVANLMIKKFTGVRINDNGCSLKAYRREVIEGVQLYGEMHRFISIYAAWSGGDVAEVVVNHRPRKHGKSKYGFSRIFKVMLDLLVIKFLYKYLSRPVHFFGKYGFWCLSLGVFFEAWAMVEKFFFHRSFVATPLPIAGMLCIVVGFQLILTGILSELLMRTYYESQQKNSYNIKESSNLRLPNA